MCFQLKKWSPVLLTHLLDTSRIGCGGAKGSEERLALQGDQELGIHVQFKLKSAKGTWKLFVEGDDLKYGPSHTCHLHHHIAKLPQSRTSHPLISPHYGAKACHRG